MIYNNINKVILENRELKWLNDLMEVCFEDYESDENMRKLIDDLDAKEDETICVCSFEFENGATIFVNISSGDSNYYDNIVLYDEKGNELYILDCDYNLNSFEFTYNNDTYIIEMESDE